ncbi:hypothetical protein ACP70R_034672 [Stipagrostis hirtigluma subsp. patula]
MGWRAAVRTVGENSFSLVPAWATNLPTGWLLAAHDWPHQVKQPFFNQLHLSPFHSQQSQLTTASLMAMRHRFSSYLAGAALAFLLVALHAPLTAAQRQPPPWLLCDAAESGNYTANSTYLANINRLSATLPKNASSSPVLYAADSVGSVPDIVYAHALCCGDATAAACERCVRAAFAGAQQGCPLFKDVMIFYDLCQLRFSNRNFLLDDDYLISTYVLPGSPVATTPPAEAFDAAVARLLNATADYAAENSSRRFSTGEEGFFQDSSLKIYALSQCTPDKTADICRKCLSTLPAFVAPQRAPAPPPAVRRRGKPRNRTVTILQIVVPIAGALVAITMICYWRRRKAAVQSFPPSDPTSSSSDDIESIDMLLVDLSTLRAATENFAKSKMLGRGGFGMVYKGVLPDGQEIAVKRLCQSSRQGIAELKSELVLVAKLHHRNLVRLVGVCLQEQEKILVYEYMPNRSLDSILFDSERNKELDWGKRFKIINGIARGLQYLHEDSRLKIVHRDLKASNILLDLDYDPKISDFGLAKIFGEDQSRYVTLRIAGTYGYMAPEYAMRGQYSIKSDVFSFGVLVLEIVTGRRNSGSCKTKKAVDLLSHVLEHWTRGNVHELMDPSLSDHPSVEQLMKCIHIGLLCLRSKSAARPTMSSVNIMLSNGAVRLPSLSRSDFFLQDVSASDNTDEYSVTHPTASERCTDSSAVMSSDEHQSQSCCPDG